MSKTIVVPEDILLEVMRRTQTDEPERAVLEALKQFTRSESQKDLIRYLGTSEGFYSDEELERLREME